MENQLEFPKMSNSAVFGSNWLESQLTKRLGPSEVTNLVGDTKTTSIGGVLSA